MKIPFMLLFIAIIILAGCTGIDTGDGTFTPNANYGVSIISFTTESATLLPNEEGLFEVKIKNTGSVKATHVFAELLGLDQSWSRDQREIFPNENECRYTVKGISLLPMDENTGSGGGEYVCTWSYKAPDIPLGEAIFNPIVRVYYNYSTTTVSTLTLVPKEQMKEYIKKGGTLKSDIVTQTKSPIRIALKPKSPIKIYPEGQFEVPLEIKIENIGGGTPCLTVMTCKKAQSGGAIWNRIKLYFDLPRGITNKNCPDGKDVFIPKGRTQTIGCHLLVSENVKVPTQKYIKAYSEYGYFVDKSMRIKVSKGL